MAFAGSRARAIALLAALVLASSCTKPGPRARGSAEVSWQGAQPGEWSGTCVYSVETRWSTSLPHVVRLEADGGERSVVLQSRHQLPSGRTELTPEIANEIQGRAMDGATVRGALEGGLTVSTRGDTTVVDFTGDLVHRDTVGFRARCRLVFPRS